MLIVVLYCRCNVTSAGFAHMTALLAPIAPLALLLEGGYNLDATAKGTEASLRVLLGERPPPISNAGAINMLAATAIREVVKKQVTLLILFGISPTIDFFQLFAIIFMPYKCIQ